MGDVILAFDTATAWTVVAAGEHDHLGGLGGESRGPAANGKPTHTTDLLALIRSLIGDDWNELKRIGVGVGPGSFTGLRIGVATARGLAQATGASVVPISTLDALAWGSREGMGVGEPTGSLLAVLDARRNEVFVTAWDDGRRTLPPQAVAVDDLPALARAYGTGARAVGDGAIRYRGAFVQAGVAVPADDDEVHVVSPDALYELACNGTPVPRAELLPDYIRKPDVDL